MRSLVVIVILLVSFSAHADLTRRAGHFRYLVGTGITSSNNISSVTNSGTGLYTVTLTVGCEGTAGLAQAAANNGSRRCFADFATASTVTVSCRNTAGSLQDLQVGDLLTFFCFCGVP